MACVAPLSQKEKEARRCVSFHLFAPPPSPYWCDWSPLMNYSVWDKLSYNVSGWLFLI